MKRTTIRHQHKRRTRKGLIVPVRQHPMGYNATTLKKYSNEGYFGKVSEKTYKEKDDLNLKGLEQFYGTTNYYNVMGVKVTDGIKYVMDNGYQWLLQIQYHSFVISHH